MDSDIQPDWRILGLSRLASDVPSAFEGGPSHSRGDLVMRTSIIDFNGEKFAFVSPHISAITLDFAINCARRALHAKANIGFSTALTPDGALPTLSPQSISQFYDLLSLQLTNIVLSFQAIESFCNAEIGNRLNGTMDVTIRNKRKKLESAAIQRLPTSQKLSEILPRLLSVSTPSEAPFWKNFSELNQLRNDAIHVKSHDMEELQQEFVGLAFRLYKYDSLRAPLTALELFDFFSIKGQRIHWLDRAIDEIKPLILREIESQQSTKP